MQFRYTDAPEGGRQDVRNLKRIFPYIWEYKGRVLIALLSLILSKAAIVGIPLIFKEIIDILDTPDKAAVAIPYYIICSLRRGTYVGLIV